MDQRQNIDAVTAEKTTMAVQPWLFVFCESLSEGGEWDAHFPRRLRQNGYSSLAGMPSS